MANEPNPQPAAEIESTERNSTELFARANSCLAHSIQVAHTANPSSWSLVEIAPGTFSLLVGRNTVLILGEYKGDVIIAGDIQNEQLPDLRPDQFYRDYGPLEATYLGGLTLERVMDFAR